METKESNGHAVAGRRGQTAAIRLRMRELNNQLSLLNHQVGTLVAIKDVDLDCLDLLARQGPTSPGALARRAGLHPATVTGILDRLEKSGWVMRERDPADRRAILVRPRPERTGELTRLYAGMNGAMDAICATYQPAELILIADFLARVIAAGQISSDALAEGRS